MHKSGVAGLVAAAVLSAGFVLRTAALPPIAAKLVVHEWGTFTALQNDDGTALGAINADDEPVPDFVCRIGSVGISPALSTLPLFLGGKGLWPCHPDVTMRLETPVIYFYPPAGEQPAPVNVRVTFRGGWLTEFYPPAIATAPGLLRTDNFPPLLSTTRGTLAWNDVELNAPGDLTPTDDPIWTTPRAVERAAVVKVPPGPDAADYRVNCPEKFLFYRGVGHLDSPLRAIRDPRTDRLSLYANVGVPGAQAKMSAAPDWRVPAAWLIEIRAGDRFCAFRSIWDALDLGTASAQPLATLPASFAPGDFSSGRLQELHESMQTALIANGLYPEEAAAMLKTWELSYFKSPGRRLFFVTPRPWTDDVLPLSIGGATITRAMIGRIELITPAQGKLLARIATGPCPDMEAFRQQYWKDASQVWDERKQRIAAGRETAADRAWAADRAAGKSPDPADTQSPVPAIYQDYLDLGRFRDALVLEEQNRRPTPALAAFIAGNNLRAPRVEHLTLSSFLPRNENSR